MSTNNSDKSNESNKKRLESLQKQLEEFKIKKNLIKNSFSSQVNPKL
jgi:hypothetical protein